MPLEAPVIRKTFESGAMHLSVGAPVLRRDAVHEHVDVLGRGAARLVERLCHRFDDLRHGLVGDAGVVQLDVDPGHELLLSRGDVGADDNGIEGSRHGGTSMTRAATWSLVMFSVLLALDVPRAAVRAEHEV